MTPNPKGEAARLRTRGWSPVSIGLRLGVDPSIVYRELKKHRAAGDAA